MDCYNLSKDDLVNCQRIEFTVVPTLEELNLLIAREIADHIKAKNERKEKSCLSTGINSIVKKLSADILEKELRSEEHTSELQSH